ncbi:hypothetical protein GCK32_007166 [Trichostrongylus colubriformis]|uniref:Uncharacterized protein n=1 Tax=Trichostrongylus colubriformis TaxID=6319 RepID=A0AAN8G2G5_TRICO
MVKKTEGKSRTARYLFRQMRAPPNRHLNEIVEEEVRAVSNVHFLREFARIVSTAALVRRQDEEESNSSTPISSPRHRSISNGDESIALSYRNPYVDREQSRNEISPVATAVANTQNEGSDTHGASHERRQPAIASAPINGLKGRLRHRVTIFTTEASHKKILFFFWDVGTRNKVILSERAYQYEERCV